MTRSPLWREFESGESFLLRLLRVVIPFGGLLFLLYAATLEMAWRQQAILAGLLLAIAFWMDRRSSSYVVTLTVVLLSCFATFRYGFWRLWNVWHFFSTPGSRWSVLDASCIGLLMAAELYAFGVMFLSFLQTCWPLRRTPVPLPENPDDWPEVDLLIPTYSEPLNVVRYTVLAAINIDWPADKLNVYILDDGRREEFRAFAEEAGVGYMTREDNSFAKAGNVNRALKRLNAPFIAIFDSDHVPTRSFLQLSMGWFVRDAKLAMLQTPHHFYSPDPFERNLGQFRRMPSENQLFYGVVQDGNDFWNAALFCGSCSVLRRSALDEVGGLATDTVTEDAHTSLRLQMRGWNTAYVNIPQAAGLATERLSGHVKQRIRWARGMMQILRTDNPLLVPGLSLAQRLCYLNSMVHFLFALPRLVFLTAPLIYLMLGHTNLPGYWAAILAYALPHLALSTLANSRIQGQHRHSFWNEVYETVLAPYLFFPTVMALISPRLGNFNVTAKGGIVSRTFFDRRIARPFVVLLAMNLLGLVAAVPRLLRFPSSSLQGPLGNLLNLPAGMYHGPHTGTILINVAWTVFNIVILSVAVGVAWESRQRRTTVRVPMAVPLVLVMADGTAVDGVTQDLSSGGAMLRTDSPIKLNPGDSIQLVFPVLDGDATLPATVVAIDGPVLRTHFDPLTLQEEEALTMVLYSRADNWLAWGEALEADRPLVSLWRLLKLARMGFSTTALGLAGDRREEPKAKFATIVPLIVLLGLLLSPPQAGSAAPKPPVKPVKNSSHSTLQTGMTGTSKPAKEGALAAKKPAARPATSAASGDAQGAAPGTFDSVLSFPDIGVQGPIALRGVDSIHAIYFPVSQTQTVATATLRLRYHASPGLLPALSHLKVSLNGSLLATLPVTPNQPLPPLPEGAEPQEKTASAVQTVVTSGSSDAAVMEATVTLPGELLVHRNELSFEFIGHYTLDCEDASNSTLWLQVEPTSSVELAGRRTPLPNDLKLLPLPFYDSAVQLHPPVPIVFAAQPSMKALQAAGILASYLGLLSDFHPLRFPVKFGSIPAGNVVLVAENQADLPAAVGVSSNGPTVAIRTNPSDPYSKVLVITGDNADQMLAAARALATQKDTLASDTQRLTYNAPAARQPDDAPRWMRSDTITPLMDLARGAELQADGGIPLNVALRLPPDLYYGVTENLPLHMFYRYNGIPLAGDSSLQMYMNGAYVGSTPLPHTDNTSGDVSVVVPVPVADMRPFSNGLGMQFSFKVAKTDRCDNAAPLNLRGSIRGDSYLDIRNIAHWATLPNLELFANAGYPFTRKADLEDTAVVLPDAPSPEEVEMFLTLMGHFGAQTGYPVLNVTVTTPDGIKETNKDYLVMGTVDDISSAIARLNDALPVKFRSGGLQVEDTHGFFAALQHAWWKLRSSSNVESGRLETVGGLPDALIEGIEWPRGSNHSAVLIALRDRGVIPEFLDVFTQRSQSAEISQSVSVLSGDRFVSYRIGNDLYHVGHLSWIVWLGLLLATSPWLLVLVVVVLCFLIAVLLRALLRRQARRRLAVFE